MCGRLTGHYDDTGPSLNAAIEILDVLAEQTDATRRHERADRRRLIAAVDAIARAAEIGRARTQRIAGAPGHHARQIRLTLDHLRRREPVRPFLHPRDAL